MMEALCYYQSRLLGRHLMSSMKQSRSAIRSCELSANLIEEDTVEPRYSAPAFNEFRGKAHDFKSPIFFFFISLLSYSAFSVPAVSENSGNSV